MRTESERRSDSGAAWDDFCDALKRAGQVVLRDGPRLDALDRAEGFRYLSRLTRLALESHIECADPAAPVFRRPAHETAKLGADNPDNHYQSATISAEFEYRIRGTRGSVAYLGLGTYAGSYGADRQRGPTGYLEAADLEIAADGSFEIEVSRTRRGSGNWLPMTSESELLIVRQTCDERSSETLADLELECLGGEGPRPVTEAGIAAGLAAAAAYVDGTARLFCDWSESFAKRPNELPPFDPALAAAAHGDPNIRYYHGYWELAPEQALLIEVTPPRCAYWNFQLNNYWLESLDFRFHRIDVNHAGAVFEADGSVRIVVAAADPGFGNWIDTAGHARGTMCLRWVRADRHPQPRVRVVGTAELAALGAA